MNSGSNRAFQLRIDPLTGEPEWVVIEEGDDDSSLEASRSSLATTSYLDMLNDSRRNRAFRLAIDKTVTGPCHVLDIGAGTGLLSMMAARAMMDAGDERKGEVSACESYLPMGKLMRRVLRANAMDRMVNLFHKRSDELKVGVDLKVRADMLVSEILDSELLGEGLIPTLQQAHDMLLVENPKTVPYRATTYGQLVESTFFWKLHDLSNNDADASDGIHLMPAGADGFLCVKPQQYAMHCNALSEEIRLLSEPFKIFEFDFWKRPDSFGETEVKVKATDNGKVNAIISWWVLQLDREGSVFYSTAPRWLSSSNTQFASSGLPGFEDWCDHWRQCVWFVPNSGMSVSKDKDVFMKAVHNEIKIAYYLDGDSSTDHSKCQLQLLPEKLAIYGDKDWRSAWSTATRNAVQSVGPSPCCVVADDSIFLSVLIASLTKSSTIISTFPGLQEKGTKYLQAVADANGFSMDRINVTSRKSSCLLKDDIPQKVDLLMGEPFYYGSEGMLPWQNLRFWKERTVLDPILSDDVVIMPYKGILKACAMSLPDLWRSRRSLTNIEGFDHSLVNETLGACGELPSSKEGPCLPYYIWQCGEIKELSGIFSLMEFDFSELIHACSGKTKIEFSKEGLCHGFALWIDWVLDEKESIVVSTGPVSRYWKQGVKLLNNPMVISADKTYAELEALFDPSTGDITINSTFSSS